MNYGLNVVLFVMFYSNSSVCSTSTLRLRFSKIYPKMPAAKEPLKTPSFAWLSRSSPSAESVPKERLAMKRATVNPIPPNVETAKRFCTFIPFGMDISPVRMDKYEKEKMPKVFPTTNPKKTAKGTCANELMLISPNVTPALTKAKSGRMI